MILLFIHSRPQNSSLQAADGARLEYFALGNRGLKPAELHSRLIDDLNLAVGLISSVPARNKTRQKLSVALGQKIERTKR